MFFALIIMLRDRTILASRLLIANVHTLFRRPRGFISSAFQRVDMHVHINKLHVFSSFCATLATSRKLFGASTGISGVTRSKETSAGKTKVQIRLVHKSTGWRGLKFPRLYGSLKTAGRAQRAGPNPPSYRNIVKFFQKP